MSIDEAIRYLQPIADSAHVKNYAAALNLAIDALREKQTRENPQPLTLNELREMNGEQK